MRMDLGERRLADEVLEDNDEIRRYWAKLTACLRSVVNRNCAAHSAPDFGAVFARGCSCNVYFHTANACDCVLHGATQWVLIDELNAQSARPSHASKHTKLLLAEKPLTSLNCADSMW